jgi:RNA polymerase subunit RPABC4/transcription elongation factor Spt4
MEAIDPELKPFEQHAFFALAFRCKKCGTYVSEDGVVGPLHSDEWFVNLGKKARAEGWTVINEWEALCPSCSKGTVYGHR